MRKLLIALLILLQPLPLQALSEDGHHIIAMMALDLLKNEEHSKLLATLEKHPRFKKGVEPAENCPTISR